MNFRIAKILIFCEKQKENRHFNIFFVAKAMISQIFLVSLTFELNEILILGGFKTWQTKEY